MVHTRRLLIVSNRLPFTAQARGSLVTLTPATGGLVTGLRHLHDAGQAVWIGWPGDVSAFPRRQRANLDEQLRARRIVPVHMRRTESKAYYDRFCNGVLWPLLHYAIDRLPLGDGSWPVYQQINERFAECVAREYREGDTIWIHDYHLMLVPGLLRARLPEAPIGFFLHVPFPAFDVFRLLPWRREILQGLLGASLIGFHTESYAAHFADAVRSLTALEVAGGAIVANERAVRVGAYAMGVDAGRFARAAVHPLVVEQVAALRGQPAAAAHAGGQAGNRLLVGIDRLDYTKGIPSRLLAFERLLQQRPDLRGHVQLLQVAVPSREDTPSYQQLRHEVEKLVGRINGELGTLTWTPVRYLYQSVSDTDLVALYRAADVMLVTPLRDGMNLVAKEFVAARTDEAGVLVLSELAGAAHELPEAIAINPYAIDELADAIGKALAMDRDEQRRSMHALRRRVTAHSVDWWAASFLHDLQSADRPATAVADGLYAPYGPRRAPARWHAHA